jgi:hypothetical protein
LNAEADDEAAPDDEVPEELAEPPLEAAELDTVTPNVEDDPAGRVVVEAADAAEVAPDPEAVDEPDCEAVEEAMLLVDVLAPTEKVPLSAKTSVMLPGLVALSVYPSRTGTVGMTRVSVCREGSTLLAMAKESLKSSLIKKRENEESVVVAVQVTVTVPSEVGFWGTLRVRAETKGATSARRATLLNMVRS